MGTEKEQAALTWAIRGPDADGDVWLDFDQPHELNSFNLGAFEDVGERLCDWLAQNDFGDRPCPSASS
jgi:hypothetical protein